MEENIFETLCSFKNLSRAYIQARHVKRFREDVLYFGFFLERNLLSLQDDLRHDVYAHGGYRSFILTDSKKRRIEVAPFRDRVVHHAVCNCINPIFEKTFIYDSYACRKGKGTHSAIHRLHSFIQGASHLYTRPAYILQCDISKYFDSIDHELLFSFISEKVSDTSLCSIIKKIIWSKYGACGVPIGNLTSQLFANIYLNGLDHFIKEELRCRYYVRYMDDFILLHSDVKILHVWRNEIIQYLFSLKLTLNPKRSGIQRIDRVSFLGYVLLKDHMLLRKQTVSRAWKRGIRMRFNDDFLNSWNGYCKHAHTHKLVEKMHSHYDIKKLILLFVAVRYINVCFQGQFCF